MILFIDTETSGFPKNGVGLEDPKQARILEIACILTDDQGKVISTLDTLVKCGDIEIHGSAFKIHGITAEECNEKGIEFMDMISLIKWYISQSSVVVAHNMKFDEGMLGIYNVCFADDKKFCTMKAMTDILKIPNRFNNGYKWANLKESADYFGLVNREAHRAMADAEMCKEIYFKIQGQSLVNSLPDHEPRKRDASLEGDWTRKPEIELQEL
jgi:DNA polymerase III epsilon subunit-like protein